MLRKSATVFAFLFVFSAAMAWSNGLGKGQAAAPAATAPAQADATSAPAKTRAFTEDSKPFLSDRHIANGLECSNCHGDGAVRKPVTTEQCLQCHESFEVLAKRTEDIKPNPHSNHLIDSQDVDCNFCHHGHKANEIGCRSCHADRVFIRNSATDAIKKP